MKKLILMTVGIAVLRQVARYFKIKSFEDVMRLVRPYVKDLKNMLPDVKTLNQLKHHLN
jgi:hypothetical protein